MSVTVTRDIRRAAGTVQAFHRTAGIPAINNHVLDAYTRLIKQTRSA